MHCKQAETPKHTIGAYSSVTDAQVFTAWMQHCPLLYGQDLSLYFNEYNIAKETVNCMVVLDSDFVITVVVHEYKAYIIDMLLASEHMTCELISKNKSQNNCPNKSPNECFNMFL